MSDKQGTKKAKRAPRPRRPGERLRIRLASGDQKFSLNVGPDGLGGYELRAIRSQGEKAVRAVERFESFREAGERLAELQEKALAAGWTDATRSYHTAESLLGIE